MGTIELQADLSRLRFQIQTIEQDILAIQRQLEDAADTPKEASDWWHRAKAARAHKERERRVLMAQEQRIVRKLERIKPDQQKTEQKAALREILKALFLVARTSLSFYEDETEANEAAFTAALDQLDEVVPDWDQQQPVEEPKVSWEMGFGK